MKSVFVIAEAGVNHNGELDTAFELVDAAATAGADAVKFQTFSAERLVTAGAVKAAYQRRGPKGDESQLDMLKRLELSREDHIALIDRCKTAGVQFMSSAFDSESIEFIDSIGVETIKIPSGEITNLPYLRRVGRLGRPTILSTGASSLDEVGRAVDVLVQAGVRRSDLTLLHCNSQYPTPFEDVNLRAMTTLAGEFGVPVGYSDHTKGVAVSIAAVALGARVIEKHLTLDPTDERGPDHSSSLAPGDFRRMVEAIRIIEFALGEGTKTVSKSEEPNRLVIRKSIVASRSIQAGEMFTDENVTTKRPADGLSPMLWDAVIGTTADRDYEPDERIVLE